MKTTTFKKIRALALTSDVAFARLLGGALSGQLRALDSYPDELTFTVTDYAVGKKYFAIYEKHSIFTLGVFDYHFVEMYQVDTDEEWF